MFEQVADRWDSVEGRSGLTDVQGRYVARSELSRYGGESSGWTDPRVNRLRFHQFRYQKHFAFVAL